MGVKLRETRAPQQAGGLMELQQQQQMRDYSCIALMDPEPQLPSGWEKCLDMKSGLIYFKDWNTGTQTYRDPRQAGRPSAAAQRIGLLSISLLSHQTCAGSGEQKTQSEGGAAITQSTATTTNNIAAAAAGSSGQKFKRKLLQDAAQRLQQRTSSCAVRLPWALTGCMAQTSTDDDDDDDSSSGRGNSIQSTDEESYDQSLDLSLNLPGTWSSRPSTTASTLPKPPPAQTSVCTVEKVRRALERSQWLLQNHRPQSSKIKSRYSPSSSPGNLTVLSLLSPPRPSTSSRESNSPAPQHSDDSSWFKPSSSPSTSHCSSHCFTSPSAMSYQGDDEEVQQRPRACSRDVQNLHQQQEMSGGGDGDEVMVAVGCKSCLMYVMMSKQHPSCPKCGNTTTDVLLHLPVASPRPPSPKRQRLLRELDLCPTWSWSTA